MIAPKPGSTFRDLPILTPKEWKKIWENELKDGLRQDNCPLCGQDTKERLRPLNWKHVRFLAVIRQEQRGDRSKYIHIGVIHREENKLGGEGERSGDYAKLRHLGLVEFDDVGFWRMTRLGNAWLDGKLMVPRKVALAEWKRGDDKLLGFSGPWVAPADVVGKMFDINRLREETGPGLRRVK
jgi:hypothetical protein